MNSNNGVSVPYLGEECLADDSRFTLAPSFVEAWSKPGYFEDRADSLHLYLMPANVFRCFDQTKGFNQEEVKPGEVVILTPLKVSGFNELPVFIQNSVRTFLNHGKFCYLLVHHHERDYYFVRGKLWNQLINSRIARSKSIKDVLKLESEIASSYELVIVPAFTRKSPWYWLSGLEHMMEKNPQITSYQLRHESGAILAQSEDPASFDSVMKIVDSMIPLGGDLTLSPQVQEQRVAASLNDTADYSWRINFVLGRKNISLNSAFRSTLIFPKVTEAVERAEKAAPPSFSIIVPFYSHESYFRRCLDSVLKSVHSFRPSKRCGAHCR